MPADAKTPSIIAVSDTHFGSSVSLCEPFKLDDGGTYTPSDLQTKLWKLWENFWDWALETVKGSPYIVVHVGDVIDGVHHKTTALSTHNLSTQSAMAISAMKPKIAKAEAYYQIRGTEAHVGASGQEEETIARELGATKDDLIGVYSRWELWIDYAGKGLSHFAHHIGSTSSAAYESSALMREIVASFVEAGQWGMRPPSLVVRGHTHRYLKIDPPNCCGVKLPAWQAKTPFTYKIDRMRGPMFGGVVIKYSNDRFDVLDKIFVLKQTRAIKIP
jgi:hypothetical protein